MAVYCTAAFQAKPGREEELFNVLKALEEPTHKEEGCIAYKVMKKIAHPNATGEHYDILMNETWASEAIFEKHCNMPYIQEFFQTHCLDESGSVEKFNVNLFK